MKNLKEKIFNEHYGILSVIVKI
jgi:hypothetical protein